MSTDIPAAVIEPAEIEIRGVSKWYGDHKVLKGVSTDVKRGEALVVIGPSGSGKTTLLRCINLLEEFQEGEIRIGGEAMGYTVERFAVNKARPKTSFRDRTACPAQP